MRYVIVGTPTCGYCRQAKQLCTDKQLEYEYVCLTQVAPAEQDRLMEIAGQAFRTVPQIFTVEGEEWSYIGGYTELRESL